VTVQRVEGRLQTEQKKVKGPICFITTTTKMRIHAENQTRVFDLYPDDSESQTANMLEIVKREQLHELPADIRERVNIWRNAQACLE